MTVWDNNIFTDFYTLGLIKSCACFEVLHKYFIFMVPFLSLSLYAYLMCLPDTPLTAKYWAVSVSSISVTVRLVVYPPKFSGRMLRYFCYLTPYIPRLCRHKIYLLINVTCLLITFLFWKCEKLTIWFLLIKLHRLVYTINVLFTAISRRPPTPPFDSFRRKKILFKIYHVQNNMKLLFCHLWYLFNKLSTQSWSCGRLHAWIHRKHFWSCLLGFANGWKVTLG